jgi:hypothetical protein
MIKKLVFAAILTGAVIGPGTMPAQAQAPYINAAVADTEFHRISAANMDLLRTKKILFFSRSFGLNLYNGLVSLAAKNSMYTINAAYKRYDIFSVGGDLSVIPADALYTYNFVHVLCTPTPYTARLPEFNDLMKDPPHHLADHVECAMLDGDDYPLSAFQPYCDSMDSWRAQWPHVKFIYVTAGLTDSTHVASNTENARFGTQIRARYKGVVPLYDWGFIVNNDSACGDHYCPAYSTDPAGIHCNTEFAQERMGKAFLLMLYKLYCENQPPCTSPDPPTVPVGLAGVALSLHSIRLTWQASTHVACGVSHYRVRRNGADIGTSYSLAYVDHNLTEGVQYQYQVAAVSRNSVVSGYCAAVPVRTQNDTIAPRILAVPTTLVGTAVQVNYSEKMDSATGLDPARYTISHGVTVQAARYFSADSIVLLTTSALPPGTTCTLTVTGVTDRSINRNPLTARATFMYNAVNLATDVIGYWGFNGSVLDASGHNLNGTWTGTAAYGPGKLGQGLNLDGTGTGGYVTVANHALLNGMGRLTIGLWARKRAANTGGTLLKKHTAYDLNSTGASLGGYLFNAADARVNISATVSAANDTNWHHYCVVYDGVAIKSYVDGAQKSAAAQTGNLATNTQALHIGKDPWGNAFNGQIDELRLYDWAVDSLGVTQLMMLGLGNADSLAVRALLDANGSSRTVDGVSIFNTQRRITELYLQTDLGGTITRITSHIGQLTELQLLNAYGPANHTHAVAHLSTIDPAISNCRKLKQLLLNDNDLTTLPAGITALDSLTSFSAGNNQLCGIAGALSTWLNAHDPDWAASQICTGVRPDQTATSVVLFSVSQAGGQVTITRGTLHGVLDADFYTTRGQLAYSIQGCPGNELVWQTGSAQSGIYFVRVTSGAASYVQRIVVVR